MDSNRSEAGRQGGACKKCGWVHLSVMQTPQEPSETAPSTAPETTSTEMSFAEMIMAAGAAAMEEVKKELAKDYAARP